MFSTKSEHEVKFTVTIHATYIISPLNIFHWLKTFGSLFTFRGLQTRGTASVACDDEQSGYFIPRAYTGTGVRHTYRKQNVREDLEKVKLNGPGR